MLAGIHVSGACSNLDPVQWLVNEHKELLLLTGLFNQSLIIANHSFASLNSPVFLLDWNWMEMGMVGNLRFNCPIYNNCATFGGVNGYVSLVAGNF